MFCAQMIGSTGSEHLRRSKIRLRERFQWSVTFRGMGSMHTEGTLVRRRSTLPAARLVVPLALVATWVAPGQVPDPPPEDPGLIITAESNLVLVPLHVYTRKTSVNGLGAEAFELREDGVLQRIAFVEGPTGTGGEESTRTVPTEIIFLIDFSFSVMTPGLLDFTTIRSTMLEGLREDVMISVYGFANNLKRFTGPTRDLAKLQKALDMSFESEAGGSRVYEAIMQTARDATNRGGNVSRMMVVFSDGLSTTNLNPDLVVRSANGLGIPLYPVVLGHDRIVKRSQGIGGGGQIPARQNIPVGRQGQAPVFGPRRNPAAGANRSGNARRQESLQRVFAEMGRKTGGRSYDLDVINNRVIRTILGSLSELAETQYVVGYYPRAVDVELTMHEVVVNLVSEEIGNLYGGHRFVVH